MRRSAEWARGSNDFDATGALPWPMPHPLTNPAGLPAIERRRQADRRRCPSPPWRSSGREDDIARVIGLLDDPGVRLLTLTGTGGVGKTRLAVEVGQRVAPEFADGVRYISLAELADATSVLPAVARGTGLRGPMGRDPLDAFLSATRERHLLLVLDNYEHLLGIPPIWLATLIGAAPRVKVLVTSRVPLNIGGEQRYLVQPFDMQATDAPQPPRDNTAVALFTQRAREVNTAFVLDDANQPRVVEICRQLDGLALAIELAAAKTTVFTPEQIVARLSDRLSLLSAGPRDAPDRQRSIRDTIGWSYDLLSEEGRRAFRRLSVFTGSASLEAIASVIAPDGGAAIGHAIEVASELVDHSLIRAVPVTDTEPRYMMLATIREFGLDQLAILGEERAARDAHADWFLRLGAAAEIGLEGSGMAVWLDRLEPDHENLRGAMSWLRSRDRIEDAITLAFSTVFYFHLRGHQADAGKLFADFLQHPRVADRTMYRAKALLGEALYAELRGEYGWGRTAAEDALALARSHNDCRAEGWALAMAGHHARADGDMTQAMDAYETMIEVGRQCQDLKSVASGLTNLGTCAMQQHRLDDAERYQRSAVRLGKDSGQPWMVALAQICLGEIALHRKDYPQAELLLNDSRKILAELGNTLDVPAVQLLLARLAIERDDHPAADRYLLDGLRAAQAIGAKESIGRISLELGRNASVRGDRPETARRLLEALTCFMQIHRRSSAADCLKALADLAVDLGDARLAARMIASAEQLRAQVDGAEPPGPWERELAGTPPRRATGDVQLTGTRDARGILDLVEVVAEAAKLERRIAEDSRTIRSRTVAERSGLTERERQVLRLLADGLTNREIAEELHVSLRTVASHIEHILTRFDLRSRTAAVAYAIRNGIA